MSSMWGLTQSGNIEFEFTDSVLKVSEDTFGDEGTLLPFLTEYIGKEYEGLFIIFLPRQIILARPMTRKGSISI